MNGREWAVNSLEGVRAACGQAVHLWSGCGRGVQVDTAHRPARGKICLRAGRGSAPERRELRKGCISIRGSGENVPIFDTRGFPVALIRLAIQSHLHQRRVLSRCRCGEALGRRTRRQTMMPSSDAASDATTTTEHDAVALTHVRGRSCCSSAICRLGASCAQQMTEGPDSSTVVGAFWIAFEDRHSR